VKVDHYMTATDIIEWVLIVVGGIAGSYAWTPYLAGYLIGAVVGFGAAYIVVEVLDRLFLIYGDPERLDRELDERRRRRREEERRKKR
jgi:hypothetical protein